MRYFLEVSYKGTRYAGFQVQENAPTIQGEVERCLAIIFKQPVSLTGSSRTDAGVHALQNFFHFDFEGEVREKILYNLNALLPPDIAIHSITPVSETNHCRFDAVSREYRYFIYHKKNPFLVDSAWYFPYPVNVQLLQQAADTIKFYTDFTSFSKRNTQVFTHQCSITKSEWLITSDGLQYSVQANRFLRGMVRGLVGTMLQIGRGKVPANALHDIFAAQDCSRVNFATPAHGLFLARVEYSFLP
jgi:tRNA pseudouridine38-40 synthase